MTILRQIGATVIGLILGGVTVATIEWLSSLMHPMPADLDLQDSEAMRQWVAALPTSAFLMVLVAWFAGCFTGAWLARLIAAGRSLLPPAIACLFFTLATIFNLVMLSHPWWMWPAGILVCLFGGILGILLSTPREFVVETTRSINAPVSRVFQTLSRVEEFSQAVPGITNIEFLSEQHYGVGTRFKETRLMNGKEATTELEVRELVENERIRMVSDAGGTIWDTVFTVSTEDQETLMTMKMDARPYNALAKLFVPMILSMVAEAVNDDMDAVKKYCETTG